MAVLQALYRAGVFIILCVPITFVVNCTTITIQLVHFLSPRRVTEWWQVDRLAPDLGLRGFLLLG